MITGVGRYKYPCNKFNSIDNLTWALCILSCSSERDVFSSFGATASVLLAAKSIEFLCCWLDACKDWKLSLHRESLLSWRLPAACSCYKEVISVKTVKTNLTDRDKALTGRSANPLRGRYFTLVESISRSAVWSATENCECLKKNEVLVPNLSNVLDKIPSAAWSTIRSGQWECDFWMHHSRSLWVFFNRWFDTASMWVTWRQS